MPQYNTDNPLGSMGPRDMYDNANVLDNIVNGDLDVYFDRLGNPRKSVKYLIELNQTLGRELADAESEDKGAELIGYKGRTVAAKLSEIVSVKDYGAKGDGVSDDAFALIAASIATTGTVFVPSGAYTASITAADSEKVLGLLSRLRVDGSLTLNLAAGNHDFKSQIVVNSPDANKITIKGAEPVLTTLKGFVSVSGGAAKYSVTLLLSSVANIKVGDYALIRADIAGTGDFYAHAGIWKITAVDSANSRITVLNTHKGAAWPAGTITSGSVVVLKTQLKFTGCDGFRFEGGQPIGLLDNVALVGDWNIADGTGTIGAHGIVMSLPVITNGANSNAIYNAFGNACLGRNVGVSAFGEQGIVVSGRCGLVANYVASCSNRKRGWYAEGGSIRAKLSIASGNGEDGFISDITGSIQAALSMACGNGLNGYWSTNNSLIACSYAKASGNLIYGFEARGLTKIEADSAISLNNGSAGFSVSYGGMIASDSASAIGNGSHGFDSVGGVINCNNSTSTNNGGYGYRSQYTSCVRAVGSIVNGNTSGSYYSRDGGVLFESSGAVNVQDVPSYSIGQRIYNPGKSLYYGLAVSSIGDLVLQPSGASRFVLKADGIFHPSADNTQSLGRSSERWSVIYAGTAAISTSDGRLKQEIQEPDEKVLRAWAKVEYCQFKFSDAVESKGEGARWHFGVIAQRVKEAFENEGLDAFAYGLLCYDEWDEQTEILHNWADELDEDGNLIRPAGSEVIQAYNPAGNRYGIRYEEALALEAALMRRATQKLEERIALLESK
ncbi:tail fiber domain-containing protein [Pseudomonas luteola]|uniref:tail fiber domain-containing protein n=1 Tax=Pseudomonas luteola TaxID=47886 RepID=UPI00289E6D87|nr:tail fiber domain-containing protein [Pseudomonas luteola]